MSWEAIEVQLWKVRIYVTPASPAFCWSSRFAINCNTACEKPSGSSETKRSLPGCAWSAERAWQVVTTGVPVAIASKILFWMPAPYRSGTTETVARHRKGRISSTVPVTLIRGFRVKFLIAGVGSLPTIYSCAAGRNFQIRGMISSARYFAMEIFAW